MPKMDYFCSKSQKLPSAGGSAPDPLPPVGGGYPPRPLFKLMNRESARPYFH